MKATIYNIKKMNKELFQTIKNEIVSKKDFEKKITNDVILSKWKSELKENSKYLKYVLKSVELDIYLNKKYQGCGNHILYEKNEYIFHTVDSNCDQCGAGDQCYGPDDEGDYCEDSCELCKNFNTCDGFVNPIEYFVKKMECDKTLIAELQKYTGESKEQIYHFIHPNDNIYISGLSKTKSKIEIPMICVPFVMKNGKFEGLDIPIIEKIYKKEIIPNFEKLMNVQDLRKESRVLIKLTQINGDYSGTHWHLEGLKQEGIMATGIIYFDSNDIEDQYLEFKQGIDSEDVNDIDYNQGESGFVEHHYKIINEEPGYVNLGKIKTDNMLFWKNNLVHKVLPYKETKQGKGYRKLLVFFLVDGTIDNTNIDNTHINKKEMSLYAEGLKSSKSNILNMLDRETNYKGQYMIRNINLCEH